MLINYFGGECCDLNDTIITKTVNTILKAKPNWMNEINNSFLSDEMKEKYINVVESRFERLNV